MTALPLSLERSVLIHATRDTVFRFLTDTPHWAKWWGAGSSIDARPGGEVYIRHPDGTESSGKVIAVEPPEHLEFTFGFNKGTPIPAGSSRVTIRLEAERAGTRLHLKHEFPQGTEAARDEHVQGWRFQLALFSNVVSDEVNARAAEIADAWFEAWADPDAASRERTLARIAESTLRFRDRYSNTDGVTDLLPHIAAAQRFMPGIRMRRKGDVRQSQGTALVDWVAAGPDGQEKVSGTNVFVLGPTGMIESVTGFTNLNR